MLPAFTRKGKLYRFSREAQVYTSSYMEYEAFRMAEMAEGQKPAIICLSKNNCSQGRKNKAALTKILGKAMGPYKNFLF